MSVIDPRFSWTPWLSFCHEVAFTPLVRNRFATRMRSMIAFLSRCSLYPAWSWQIRYFYKRHDCFFVMMWPLSRLIVTDPSLSWTPWLPLCHDVASTPLERDRSTILMNVMVAILSRCGCHSACKWQIRYFYKRHDCFFVMMWPLSRLIVTDPPLSWTPWLPLCHDVASTPLDRDRSATLMNAMIAFLTRYSWCPTWAWQIRYSYERHDCFFVTI